LALGSERRKQLSDADLAKVLARMENEDRKINVREYMASSVMSAQQWETFIDLKRELSTRHLTILAGVPLTAIVDPYKHSLPDSLWRSSVLFAVVTLVPYGAVRLLVLDAISNEMERCLDNLRVPHVAYNVLLPVQEFEKIVTDEIDFQFQAASNAKSLVNRSENDVAESLRRNVRVIEYEHMFANDLSKLEMHRHFESRSMKLLQEVALHRFCKSGLIGGLLSLDQEHIRDTSSVDILVHAPPPLNQPLLALEFDGPHHDDPRKHGKDRLKDAVLEHYGIPLIRVSYKDASYGNLSRPGKAELHNLFDEGLTDLVGAIVWQKHFEDESAIRMDPVERRLFELEDQVAHSLFGKPHSYLNNTQRRRVETATFGSEQHGAWLDENSLSDYEWDKAMERAKEGSCWSEDLLPYSACPEIFGDTASGFWAEFSVSIQSVQVQEVALPRVWIQAKGLDETLLHARVVSVLHQISAEVIRMIVRKNTPATRR
jgi:hypothetical protein